MYNEVSHCPKCRISPNKNFAYVCLDLNYEKELHRMEDAFKRQYKDNISKCINCKQEKITAYDLSNKIVIILTPDNNKMEKT